MMEIYGKHFTFLIFICAMLDIKCMGKCSQKRSQFSTELKYKIAFQQLKTVLTRGGKKLKLFRYCAVKNILLLSQNKYELLLMN